MALAGKVDTWSVTGTLKDSIYILTSYGHPTQASAKTVVEKIKPLCKKIVIAHTTREGPRKPWRREEFVILG